jgi:pimeloyl-ACP methyl ester carboxylesterase
VPLALESKFQSRPGKIYLEGILRSFVFIPGAWHGAWCFDELASMLRQAGHHVSTPDLPGVSLIAESDASITLEYWAAFVARIIVQCPEPPVLVGHSRGGIIVSQVAELIPDEILESVYLAAALLPNGAVPLDGLLSRMPPGTQASQLPAFLDPPSFEVVRATAFSHCDAAVARDAYRRLAPEPVEPLKAPLRLSEARFGSVPRTYIETLRDNAVLLEEQRAMQARLPCSRVMQIDSDHSPFLSACRDLARALLEVAKNPQR